MKRILILFAILLQSPHISKAQASFSVSTQLCSNAITMLTASTGAMSNCTYTWSGSPAGINFSAANASVTNVSFSTVGSFSILLTVASGTLISTLQAAVDVFGPPALSLTASSYTTCITDNSPLTTKAVTLTASGGTSYTWNPNPAQGPVNGSVVVMTPTSTSCFSIAGANTVGCTSTAAACVSVIPQFTIAVTPSLSFICTTAPGGPDNYVDLSIVHSPSPVFGEPYSYEWSGSGFIVSRFIPTVRALLLSTSSFTAEARTGEGCVSRPAVATVVVEVCTGLQDATDGKLLTVYPNPVVDKLFFQLGNTDSELVIRLYNSLGELVLHEQPTGSFIELSHLAKGIYILQTEAEGQLYTQKVVKD